LSSLGISNCRSSPTWADFLLCLAWVLRMGLTLLAAVVVGFLVPHSDAERVRPFGPDI
jgi:hypothetical protein